MKKIDIKAVRIAAAAVALMTAALAGVIIWREFAPGRTASNEPLTVWVASDLHYIPKELTNGSPLFAELTRQGDGKQLEQIVEITDALLDGAKTAKPDVLILSGDLSYNGEYDSHVSLAARLAEVEAAGVTVLVTPGNHDVNCFVSMRFEGDEASYCDYTYPEEFAEIYADYGRGQAISRDKSSLSYVYQVGGVWFAVLDTTATTSGAILSDTFEWLEKQLAKGEKRGVTMIGVSHHNLLVHNPRFDYGYTVYHNERLLALCERYGVRLNLSGHLHIQSIAEKDGVYDIASGSLAVYPFQHGVMTIASDGGISYRTQKTDVQGWAERGGSDDPILLDFERYSYQYMTTQGRDKTLGSADELELTEEERRLMLEAMVTVNRAYYAGNVPEVRDSVMAGEGWRLWQEKASGTSKYRYLLEMLAGDGIPDDRLEIAGG